MASMEMAAMFCFLNPGFLKREKAFSIALSAVISRRLSFGIGFVLRNFSVGRPEFLDWFANGLCDRLADVPCLSKPENHTVNERTGNTKSFGNIGLAHTGPYY